MASANDTETFQHYQVAKRPDGTLWELGRGAMGITYKAFDTNLRTDVALKVINALYLDSETARARFQREARAAAGLRHRNVATVYHLGSDEQSFFYAMEFIDGETVESRVKRQGTLSPPDALQIVVQIARALGAASKQNLVHRDIKPANIMVMHEDEDEDQVIVKVIDFGLARPALGGEGSAHITMGGFVGTPQFASPEQLEEKDLDTRSDIYSLGITLWYMLAGKPPFVGALGSVFIQQLTKDPPWDQLEGLHPAVRALLAHMLHKDPDKRPQSPVELRREVEACIKTLAKQEQSRTAGAAKKAEAAIAESEDDTRSGDSAGETDFSPPLEDDSSTPPSSVDLEAASSSARTAALTLGSRLSGRYELVSLIGEGNNGRVFQARDEARGGAFVAVKIFHADVMATAPERRRVETEIAKLRRAAHPNLLEVINLDEAGGTTFLVTEWVNGFTLVDLLRSRGQLPLREASQLLVQAVAAADHARAHDLRRIELGLHQILAHFPTVPASNEADSGTKTALARPLEQWPAFTLKLDALGITREGGDSVTWGGERTMMPAAQVLGRDTQTSIRGFVEGSDLFALGMLLYELLNGAPPALNQRGDNGREARYVALPALNEAANMVLRRALSPNPGFASNTEFYEALMEASGLAMPAVEPGVPLAPSVPMAPTGSTTVARTLVDAPVAPSETLIFEGPQGASLGGDEDSGATLIFDEKAAAAPAPIEQKAVPAEPFARDEPLPADPAPAPVEAIRSAPPEAFSPIEDAEQDSAQTLWLEPTPTAKAADAKPAVEEISADAQVVEAKADTPEGPVLPEPPVVLPEAKAVFPGLPVETLPVSPEALTDAPESGATDDVLRAPEPIVEAKSTPERVIEERSQPGMAPPITPSAPEPMPVEPTRLDRADVSLDLSEEAPEVAAKQELAPVEKTEPSPAPVVELRPKTAESVTSKISATTRTAASKEADFLETEPAWGSGGSKLPVIAGAAVVALMVVGGAVAFLSRTPSPPPVRPVVKQTTVRPTTTETEPPPKAPDVTVARVPAATPTPTNVPVVVDVAPTPVPVAQRTESTPPVDPTQGSEARPEPSIPAPTTLPTLQEAVVLSTTPAPKTTPEAGKPDDSDRDEGNKPRRNADTKPRRDPTPPPVRTTSSRPPPVSDPKPPKPKPAEASVPRATPPPAPVKAKPTPPASTPRPLNRQPGLS